MRFMVLVLTFALMIAAASQSAYAVDNINLYCNERYSFCLNFPPGWTIKEGTQANVVKKAVDGKGGNLNINVIEAERKLNKNDIDEFFTNEYLQEFKNSLSSVMQDFSLVSSNKSALGGKRALYVKFKGSFVNAGVKANTTGIAVISAHNNYMLRITGGGLSENYGYTEPVLLKSISTFRYTDKNSKTRK